MIGLLKRLSCVTRTERSGIGAEKLSSSTGGRRKKCLGLVRTICSRQDFLEKLAPGRLPSLSSREPRSIASVVLAQQRIAEPVLMENARAQLLNVALRQNEVGEIRQLDAE